MKSLEAKTPGIQARHPDGKKKTRRGYHVRKERKAYYGKKSRDDRTRTFIERLTSIGVVKKCSNSGCEKYNFQTETKCNSCQTLLPLVDSNKDCAEKVVFMDLERVDGDLKSPPLSIGMAVVDDNGETISTKEIFILPEGSEPSRGCWAARNLHGIYIDKIRGVKILKVKNVPVDTLSPEGAAREMIKFLAGVGRKVTICFNGKDHVSLIPYLVKYHLWEEFSDIAVKLVDTQPFYQNVQGPRNYELKWIVKDWAP